MGNDAPNFITVYGPDRGVGFSFNFENISNIVSNIIEYTGFYFVNINLFNKKYLVII